MPVCYQECSICPCDSGGYLTVECGSDEIRIPAPVLQPAVGGRRERVVDCKCRVSIGAATARFTVRAR